MIAGGIGIPPFRSMLKQLELSANERERRAPIHLLYIDGEGNHLFKDELAKISQLEAIHLVLLDARDALYEEINTFSLKELIT